MNNYLKLMGLGVAIALSGTMASCHDDQILSGGEGYVKITPVINTDVRVKSRAIESELTENCLIHIYNPKGLVRRYKGVSEIPAEGIRLVSDHYVAEAWAGDSVSASFDDRWFKGREEFEVTNKNVTQVNLVCKIANVVANVNYADEIDEVMPQYSMTVGHSRGTLEYTGRDERWGYFMMPNSDKNLTWTLTGTLANGDSYTRTGVIENVNPATLYTLNVKHNGGDGPDIGGGYLTIEVDESALEVNDVVVVAIAPVIQGVGFNIDEPVLVETGKATRKQVHVGSAAELKSFVIECAGLGNMIGHEGDDYDLLNINDDMAAKLNSAGIHWTNTPVPDEETGAVMGSFSLVLTEDLMKSLPDGTNDIKLIATDANDKTSVKTMTVIVTNADVMPTVDENDVWATKATLHGSILKAGVTNPSFMYRKVGEQTWTPVADVTVSGNTYSAEVTGLEPGTDYEFITVADGYTGTDVEKFRTELATQMPNSSFEDWDESGKVHLIYAPGGQKFWDSGNEGSSTMNINVTTRATDKVHHGNSSIKLQSRFAGVGGLIGKLAAGNVFIGEYLKTDGTNGILGWGRGWNTRPTSVSGYYHYTPKAVTHVGDGRPSGVEKGVMDQAKIYIAITDNQCDSYDGKNFPFIIKTNPKTLQLFDVNSPNIIAYGELVITEATAGDDLVPFTIELTYRSNKKASNIMMVASSSIWGDYFSGGEYSTLYLDDLKLNY